MHTPYLSVIIPCYNMERYLNRAFNSLTHQVDDPNLWEIIFVDDGSTDGTLAKLQTFARQHPNARVIQHEQNRGTSAARNTAMQAARGKYITFMDPDDAVDYYGYQKLLHYVTNDETIDILSYHCRIIPKSASKPLRLNGHSAAGRIEFDGDSWDFYCQFNAYISCIFFYSRELLLKHNLQFVEGMTMLEDTTFNLSIMVTGCRVVRVSDVIYNYIQRPNSATNTKQPSHVRKHINSVLHAFHIMHDHFLQLSNGSPKEQAFASRIASYTNGKYTYGLMSSLLISDLSTAEIKNVRATLTKLQLYPFHRDFYRKPITSNIYGLMMKAPVSFTLFRPAYRKVLAARS